MAELARAAGDSAALGDRSGKVMYRVSTTQMRRLYAVERAIAAAAELEPVFVIVDGQIPNAFAGVGDGGQRVVGINFGMLELIGLDMHMAAALIGHEIAHLKLEHGDKAQAQEESSDLLGAIGGTVMSGLGVPAAGLISGLSVSAAQSAYSREHEREADYLGAIWAIESGFDADGAVRLHEAISAGTGGQVSPFFSTHPSGPERIATLRELSERLRRE